jgi:hypothetical protein
MLPNTQLQSYWEPHMTASFIHGNLLLLIVVPSSIYNWPLSSLYRNEYQLNLQPTNFITCPPEQVSSSSSCRSYLQVKFSPIVCNFWSHIVTAHATKYSASVVLSATHGCFLHLEEPFTPYCSTKLPLELTVQLPLKHWISTEYSTYWLQHLSSKTSLIIVFL